MQPGAFFRQRIQTNPRQWFEEDPLDIFQVHKTDIFVAHSPRAVLLETQHGGGNAGIDEFFEQLLEVLAVGRGDDDLA